MIYPLGLVNTKQREFFFVSSFVPLLAYASAMFLSLYSRHPKSWISARCEYLHLIKKNSQQANRHCVFFLIRCKHSQRAANQFLRWLEKKLYASNYLALYVADLTSFLCFVFVLCLCSCSCSCLCLCCEQGFIAWRTVTIYNYERFTIANYLIVDNFNWLIRNRAIEPSFIY